MMGKGVDKEVGEVGQKTSKSMMLKGVDKEARVVGQETNRWYDGVRSRLIGGRGWAGNQQM